VGTVQWRTLCEILGGGACGHAPQKIFKIRPSENGICMQHSENTFCKKLGFQNAVLINGIKLQIYNVLIHGIII
jgi:hypothetical protein